MENYSVYFSIVIFKYFSTYDVKWFFFGEGLLDLYFLSILEGSSLIMDCNYTFAIDLASKVIPFGARLKLVNMYKINPVVLTVLCLDQKKILQQKRHVEASYWDPSKLIYFNRFIDEDSLSYPRQNTSGNVSHY